MRICSASLTSRSPSLPTRAVFSLGLSLALSLLLSLVALGCSKQSPSGTPPPSQPAAPSPADPAATPADPAAPPTTVDAGALDPKPPAEALADCDVSKVRCRRMPPQCKEGEVATASGSCFGECVAIERCRCSATVACPQTDKYTCWHNEHCGPYVR